MIQATYSPDDNKLRVSSVARLDEDTCARLKAAGFRWAPAQQLWVAPMWTPEREDVCLDLAGEIDDEDTTLAERAADRADRFEGYSGNRQADGDASYQRSNDLADRIPFGQPILVGHHSEKGHRADLKRIRNAMDAACRNWATAKYWTDRAARAIEHAKYKELPAVRARRIKSLEADERKQARAVADLEKCLAFWSSDPTREQALQFTNGEDHGGVKLPTGESHWSAMTDDLITVEEVKAQRLERLPEAIAHRRRWIEHYQHRIGYEKAMLGEQGGLPADRVKPEKGGAVKCWAGPGHGRGWAYIVRANKASVTVYDNWGNGGPNFTRTIPFDKIPRLMTKAEVDAARELGAPHFAESVGPDGKPDGRGFFYTAPGLTS